MQQRMKRFSGILLSLVMVLGLMPGMSLTAYAYDVNPYASLVNSTTTVSFNGKPWYIIADNSTAVDAGTVTLLAADTSFGTSVFDSTSRYSNAYSGSTVKGVLDALTAEGGAFADVKDAIADTDLSDVGVTGAKLYLLSRSEAGPYTAGPYADFYFTGAPSGGWWLRSPGGVVTEAVFINGDSGSAYCDGGIVSKEFGVRPALNLNLSSVLFSSESKTFTLKSVGYNVTITAGSNMTKTETSGAESQTGLSGAMTRVVYTANDGYYFPEDYSVTAVNGISVTRDSYTQIMVYGTPTANAAITLTAPTVKTTPDAPTTAAATDCTDANNNDGKLTGVTTAMEHKKSDAESWTAGTGSDITGLVPGTYYVRVKATDTTNASANQELTIEAYVAPTYTVTYKIVNGTWSDDTTADRTETVQSGSKPASVPTGMKASDGYTGGAWDVNPADTTITGATTFTYTFTAVPTYTVTYKVVGGTWSDDTAADKTETVQSGSKPASVPTGMKAASGYTGGAWDTNPADATITGATTFTYTFTAKQAATVTKAPEAKTLTYTGSAQALVTAGTAEGGTMQYALGENAAAAPADNLYTTSIPTKTEAGIYYVWYKVVGDSNHYDCNPKCVSATISAAGSPDNQDPGNQSPNNQDPGKKDPNNQDPGKKDPNNQDPGKKDPNNGGNNQGGGNRKDKKTEKITISKRPASVKAKVKKSKVKVSWKKIKKNKAGKKLLKQIHSIQIQYSTDKTFKKDVRTKTVGKKKTKVTLKLQKKTTYYIRVRYKAADGFSKWSKVKKVKTKK